MDVGTGASEIAVEMPKRWPSWWNHNAIHYLILDNNIGFATATVKTAD